MTFGRIRPAGEPLPRRRREIRPEEVLPDGYEALFVQSGTAALALALLLIKEQCDAQKKRVLLPGYGCPDLVAAVVYAGLEPDFVDTRPNSPFLSLESVEHRLSEDVLAVVSAHFLGLADDIEALRAICDPYGVIVIEDGAQKIPGSGGIPPVANFVVQSFGRGKPIGAMGGGALLIKTESSVLADAASRCDCHANEVVGDRFYRLLYPWLFNLAIRPAPYAILSRLPWLNVGEVRYRPLKSVRPLDSSRLVTALEVWSKVSYVPNGRQVTYRDELAKIGHLYPDERIREQLSQVPVTRYPLLIEEKARLRLQQSRAFSALGFSVMYGKTLPELVRNSYRGSSRLINAQKFADCLLTLPVHEDAAPEKAREVLHRYV